MHRALQRTSDLTGKRADAEQPRVPSHGAAAMPADADHRLADLRCRRGYRQSPVARRIDDLFSGIGIFYPDGTPTQNVGVRLDVEVLPTTEGVQAGRDEVLERALELARQ